MSDARRTAPHVARNAAPIIGVLREILPATGLVLEVASGTGAHVALFAQAFPNLVFQPSDPDPEARASIAAWVAQSGLPHLRPPLALDAEGEVWPLARVDAVLCINMVHISPWAATVGLLRAAARLLPAGGPLYLYGPYRQADVPTAPSNEAFDQSLRARNPDWGLRDLETVISMAIEQELTLDRVVAMPANNLSVTLRKI